MYIIICIVYVFNDFLLSSARGCFVEDNYDIRPVNGVCSSKEVVVLYGIRVECALQILFECFDGFLGPGHWCTIKQHTVCIMLGRMGSELHT